MPTLKATLTVPHREEAERLSDLLEAVFEAEALPVSLFEEEERGVWTVEVFRPGSEVSALEDAVREALGGDAFAASLSVEVLDDRDWVSASLEGLPPVRAGRFVIHGRHAASDLNPTDIGLLIEAGQAFGTGHHGTTMGCLEAIEWLAARQTFRTALDLGTGTGVLAIAIAKRQSTKILATDIDPVAVHIARHNAVVNQVGARIHVQCSDTVPIAVSRRGFERGYDLIIANILARPLLHFAEPVAQHTRRGGWVVLSGLMRHQERAIIARYRGASLLLARRIYHGEWVTLVLRKP